MENTSPWRCHACDALLGVERGGELHVKYKDTELWVAGTCRRACRRCGALNERSVGAARGRTAR